MPSLYELTESLGHILSKKGEKQEERRESKKEEKTVPVQDPQDNRRRKYLTVTHTKLSSESPFKLTFQKLYQNQEVLRQVWRLTPASPRPQQEDSH